VTITTAGDRAGMLRTEQGPWNADYERDQGISVGRRGRRAQINRFWPQRRAGWAVAFPPGRIPHHPLTEGVLGGCQFAYRASPLTGCAAGRPAEV